MRDLVVGHAGRPPNYIGYVSNLTLFLSYAGARAAVDSAWTLQAKHYTVSKMGAVIPSFGDDDDH